MTSGRAPPRVAESEVGETEAVREAAAENSDGLQFASAAGRWVVAATVLGSGLASLDASVVGIALPVIGRDFHASVAGLQWVSNGYLLTLAGLLLLGGSLGDRYGRRRIFSIGVAWFALASLLCAVAPNTGALVTARLLQGIGGALLMPGSLAILQGVFRPDDRARAIGAWSGFGGLTSAIGPFVGGYLISAVSWRLIFLINLPLAVAVLVISARHVPESKDPEANSPPDAVGAALATLGLVGITYGLIEGPTLSFQSPEVLLCLIGGAALFVGFVIVERHRAHPLLPCDLFSSRQFVAANLVTFVLYGALSGSIFLFPFELEQVARYSPLEAGASLLPVTLIMLVLSARMGGLATKFGPRLFMGLGPIAVAAGFGLTQRIGSHANYLSAVLPAVVVIGLGLAVTVAPLTSTVLAAAPGRHSGVASAVNNDVARVGGLITIALLPAVVGLSGASYLHPARLNHGFHLALLLCALATLASGVLSLLTIRNTPGPVQAPPRQSASAPVSGA